MKIAIQANPSRGKEIISLLESLGGSNPQFSGNGEVYTYYIDNNNIIRYDDAPKDYKVYTLEEFEKEFPFKVGDRVESLVTGLIGTITKFFENGIYHFKYDNGICSFTVARYLKLYKEMKEERNITLTLDKAKEWYKKGGELKEIALQAFTEKELTKVDLPKTWEEFCKNHPMKSEECYIGVGSQMHILHKVDEGRNVGTDRNVCPSQKSAEAHLAMIQLEQLRDCWRQGNIPQEVKYKIRKIRNKYEVVYGIEDSFLSFCNLQTAEEFLECFRDLIEKAGDLI